MDVERALGEDALEIHIEADVNVTFVLYESMTALDLVGPYQVLCAVPQARIRLAAVVAGPKRTDSGMTILAEHALADIDDPDVIVVPGTGDPQRPLSDPLLLAWLARQGPRATWLCSVCTGSLILGAAGLLRGRRATSHWLALPLLREFSAEPVQERVVIDGTVVTSAGVAAGIDMALILAERIWGVETAQIAQLAIEYDPEPPQRAGSPRSAPAAIVAAATQLLTAAAERRAVDGSAS
jgi:transcriptional regulator GlxA family with amidase domain